MWRIQMPPSPQSTVAYVANGFLVPEENLPASARPMVTQTAQFVQYRSHGPTRRRAMRDMVGERRDPADAPSATRVQSTSVQVDREVMAARIFSIAAS